jgi:hypothetical protein
MSRLALTRFKFIGMAVLAAAVAALATGLSASSAKAFSASYCGYDINPGRYCGHGNYNSIIYNRSQAASLGNNNCVYMITEAGNLRGNGAVVCDNNSDGQARMCVSGATPMSEGRTYPEIYTDRLDGVVNNTTYDSGCAV